MSIFYSKKPADFNQKVAVSTVFLDCKDSLLLLQRVLTSRIAPGKWGVPGGKLEIDETPLEGLRREIYEELFINLDTENLVYMQSFYVRHSSVDYQLHLFRCTLPEYPQIVINPLEHNAFIWQDKRSLHELSLLEGQYEAFKLSGYIES